MQYSRTATAAVRILFSETQGLWLIDSSKFDQISLLFRSILLPKETFHIPRRQLRVRGINRNKKKLGKLSVVAAATDHDNLILISMNMNIQNLRDGRFLTTRMVCVYDI